MSLLQRWREAESAIGDPARVEAAASALPARLATLLRAMEALDADAPLDRLADDHADIAALLGALQGRPIPAGVPETVELPFGEVIAAVVAATGGAPARTSPRLDLASGYRPVLHALHRAVTDDRTDVYTNPVLAAFSPRADQVQMALRTAQVTGFVARSRLGGRLTADGLRLQPDRWPDRTIDRIQGDLLFWATTRIPWDAALEATISDTLTQDEASIRRALGAVLSRLGRDLALGRTLGSAGPARAAFSLAWRLGGPRDLVTQLALLELRVERFDAEYPGRSPVLLVHLFRERAHLSAPERAAVATALLSDALGLAPEAMVAEAVLLLITTLPDPEAAAEVLLQHASRWPPHQLLSGMKSAPPLRQVLAAGLHAASNSAWAPAVSAVARLAREGQARATTPIVRTLCGVASRTQGPAPDLSGAWSALAVAEAPPSTWAPAVADPAHRASLGEAAATALASALRPWTRDDDLAAAIVITDALGDAAQQREAVLAVGRQLRVLAPGDAADLALRTLAWLMAWTGDRGRALVAGVARPIAAFLRRDEGQHATLAASRLPLTGPLVAGAVAWWLAEGPGRPDHGLWRDRLRSLLAVPASISALFTAVARESNLASATTLAEAAAILQRNTEARLEAAPRPAFTVTPAPKAPAPFELDPAQLPLTPPALDRCRPPVFIDHHGRAQDDPRAVLGLGDGPLNEDLVRARFREGLLTHLPESDPAGAERVRRARDRLLDPDQLLVRELGVLHVPDAAAWSLELPVQSADRGLRADARLLGQLALYTLVEEALWNEGLGPLFNATIAAEQARAASAQ